ncbi:MAG: hypothetical protein QM726_14395 [Chitinophagaceae bacterium]
MLKRLLLSLLLLMFISSIAYSQVSIEPVIGFQKDLNNRNLYLLNTGLRLGIKTSPGNEFLVQAQVSWPSSYHPGPDSSFTTNSSLPLYSPAQKNITTNLFSFAIGDRFQVAGWHTKGKWFTHVLTGIMHQRLAVDYAYDKANYIILNPDKTQEVTNVFVSAGIAYLYPLGPGRLLLEMDISSGPFGRGDKYPYKTNLIAPLSLNIGYSIQLSKTKHEK